MFSKTYQLKFENESITILLCGFSLQVDQIITVWITHKLCDKDWELWWLFGHNSNNKQRMLVAVETQIIQITRLGGIWRILSTLWDQAVARWLTTMPTTATQWWVNHNSSKCREIWWAQRQTWNHRWDSVLICLKVSFSYPTSSSTLTVQMNNQSTV